jgi:hypothetical protein
VAGITFEGLAEGGFEISLNLPFRTDGPEG